MKYAFYIVIILTLASCKGNSIKFGSFNGKLNPESDSVILKTDSRIVYITSDTTSDFYNYLCLPGMSPDEIKENYGPTIERITTKHFKGLPKSQQFSPIHFYNGNYYVYAPSDWMFSTNVLLTDSVIHVLQDYHYYTIQNFSKNTNGDLDLELLSSYEPEKLRLSIKYLDIKKGITEWTWTDENNKIINSELKVNSEEVRRFKMIVNTCFDQKCFEEFNFEK